MLNPNSEVSLSPSHPLSPPLPPLPPLPLLQPLLPLSPTSGWYLSTPALSTGKNSFVRITHGLSSSTLGYLVSYFPNVEILQPLILFCQVLYKCSFDESFSSFNLEFFSRTANAIIFSGIVVLIGRINEILTFLVIGNSFFCSHSKLIFFLDSKQEDIMLSSISINANEILKTMVSQTSLSEYLIADVSVFEHVYK